MKAVLDTNVFISGVFWKGNSNKIITNWREGKFILVTSLETISEIIKILKDFKIKLSDKILQLYIKLEKLLKLTLIISSCLLKSSSQINNILPVFHLKHNRFSPH